MEFQSLSLITHNNTETIVNLDKNLLKSDASKLLLVKAL